MASTYLSRTPSSAGNQKTFTISTWVKFHQFSPEKFILTSGAYGGSRSFSLASGTNAQLDIQSNSSGVQDYFIRTNRVFRDVTGWYHIVVAVDTTQATSTDRVKIYINGVQETSFSSASYPSLNFDTGLNSTQEHQINGRPSTSDYGSVNHAHYHLIDGTAYDASAFGETDATTGIWKPKTAPSVTYGTNGFFLKFENSGSMGLDSSPNGNNFTVNGTLTQTVDTPSNVFATLNPLNNNNANLVFTNGNLKATNSTSWLGSTATLAVSQGKWYWEVKYISGNFGFGIGKIGTSATETVNLSLENEGRAGKFPDGYEYFRNFVNSQKINNNSSASYGTVASVNDVFMVAFDADIGAIWVGRNGTWYESATQAEIEAGTTTNAMFSGITINDFFTPTGSFENGSLEFNFGNGYFGTTAVSSATSDESGLGIFEYTVPSGYYALCTKNINEQEYA